MKLFLLAVLAVALTVGACGNKSPKKPLQDDASALCADDLRAWMKQFVAEGGETALFAGTANLVRLPAESDIVAMPRLPVITVDTSAIAFHGVHMASVGAVVDDTSSEWKIVELYEAIVHPRDRHTVRSVIVEIDVSTPWKVVRRVAKTAEAAGVDQLYVAFVKKTTVPAPGPSSVDDRIAEIVAELAKTPTKAAALSQGPPADHPLETVYEPCPAALEKMVEVWQAGVDGRDAFLVDALPTQIEECGCNVEIEALEAVHWLSSGRATSGGDVAVTKKVAAGTVDWDANTTPDNTPWSEAYKVVQP